MSVLGRLAGAVVRRGASLLRRDAVSAVKSSVKRVPVKGTAGLSKTAFIGKRSKFFDRYPDGVAVGKPGSYAKQGVRYSEDIHARAGHGSGGRFGTGGTGGTARSGGFGASRTTPPSTPSPTPPEPRVPGSIPVTPAGSRLGTDAAGPTIAGRTRTTGLTMAARREATRERSRQYFANMSPVNAAARKVKTVAKRYFTEGTAGKGLNMKRAIPAAAAAAVPLSIGLGEGVLAIKRKVDANKQEAQRIQRSAETASQATPTSSSIAAADLSSSGSSSSSGSTSTDQAPVSRTDSTTGIGGALQGEMRASAKAVRPDRDYMGESFDATLRKGVSSGRAYLKQQLASDKIDSKRQGTLLDQYDRKIGKDTLLGRDRGVGYVSKADTDQTQKDLLSAYRGRFGQYRKNAKASEVEAMAKAAAAKRGN
jgi:hypothetical protein